MGGIAPLLKNLCVCVGGGGGGEVGDCMVAQHTHTNKTTVCNNGQL